MKKLLVILLFFFTVPLMAQQLWWVDTTSTGDEKKVYLGNFDTEITSGGLRFAKLPVKLDSTMIVRIDSLIADMATSKGYLLYIKENTDSLVIDVATVKGYLAVSLGYTHPNTLTFSQQDSTVTTEIDSFSISATVKYSIYCFSVDGVLSISWDNTNWHTIRTYGDISVANLSPISFPKVYIKRKTGATAVTYDFAWIGY